MDQHVAYVLDKRVERTIKNLEKNNMNGYFVQNEYDAVEIIQSLMKEGDTVSVGGSMTLFEIDVFSLLKNGMYNYLDRYEEGLTPAQTKEVYRKCFSADIYLTGSNAITENGELYNVDGRGNRVAAMIYGPDKVIVVVGINKIVRDFAEAERRNREMAAPANVRRLNKKTPCAETGYCMDCLSKDRICNDFVAIKRQPEKGRIHVVIVNKDLGY